jgi:hypothetical protein
MGGASWPAGYTFNGFETVRRRCPQAYGLRLLTGCLKNRDKSMLALDTLENDPKANSDRISGDVHFDCMSRGTGCWNAPR